MQIFIKFEGRSIVIEIDGRNKIEKVKGIIEDKEGIPVELQFLSYGNKPLLDNYRLEDYDIKSRFTLYLGIKGGSKNETNCILINIRIPEDKKFKCPSSIKLYTQTTVIQLKEEIELKLREELVENEMNMNIEFNEMVLSQYGKVLNDAEVVRLGSCLEVIFILVFGVYNVSGTKITDIKMENREVKCFELKNKINEILGIMPKELFTKTNIGNFQIEEDSSIIPLQSKLCISSKINILITSLIRNTFSLEVDLFCNVLSVKELIKDRENIPIDNQCLTYEENTLLSQDPLFLNSNIEEESVLFLCISPPILLNIKSSVGQNIPFEIEMNETVEMLKERYCCGILPIHEQIILFQGTKLDDQSSLNQYIFLETSLEVITKDVFNERRFKKQKEKISHYKKEKREQEWEYCCPITHELMSNPVVAEDGHSYDRNAIEHWFLVHNTSPMTNLAIGRNLVPNIQLKKLIDIYNVNKK